MHDQILKRSGLKAAGLDQHSFQWQPSHQRAHANETTDQRHLRKGNDAADRFANPGRQLSRDVGVFLIATKARYDATKNWVKWVDRVS